MNEIGHLLQRHGLVADATTLDISPLTGGFWNDVFRVQAPGLDWVVKRYRRQPPLTLFPILPESEAAALQLLDGRQVAPRPVAFFPAETPRPALLVYHYLPGEPWRGDVVEAADLLRRLHLTPLPAATSFRQLSVDPQTLLAAGDALLQGAAPGRWVERVRAARPAIRHGPSLQRRCLVHSDVWPGNLLATPQGLRLIDWQCPGLGDAAEDIWTLLISGFDLLQGLPVRSRGERQRFLASYDRPDVTQRLHFLSPYFAYRLAGYCCLRRQALATSDPVAAERYTQVLEHQLVLLAAANG